MHCYTGIPGGIRSKEKIGLKERVKIKIKLEGTELSSEKEWSMYQGIHLSAVCKVSICIGLDSPVIIFQQMENKVKCQGPAREYIQ